MLRSPLKELEHALHAGTGAVMHAGDVAGSAIWDPLGFTHQRGRNPGALAMLLDPLIGVAIRASQGKPPTRAQAAQLAAMFPGPKPRTGYLNRKQAYTVENELLRQRPEAYLTTKGQSLARINRGHGRAPEKALLDDMAKAGLNLKLPPEGHEALGSGYHSLADLYPTNTPYWQPHGGFPRIGQRTMPPFRGLPMKPGDRGLGMELPSIDAAMVRMLKAGFIPSWLHPYLNN